MFHFNILTFIWVGFFPFLDLLCGRIGALSSELSPKSKICSCSLASSQLTLYLAMDFRSGLVTGSFLTM